MSLAAGTLPEITLGCIDFFSYSTRAAGWIVCGWIGFGWTEHTEPADCSLIFEDREITGDAIVCLFPRADVKKFGMGYVLYLASTGGRRELQQLVLRGPAQLCRIPRAKEIRHLAESEAIERAREQLIDAPRNEQRAALLKLFGRTGYTGQDTIDQLPAPAFIEVDAVYYCPPSSLVIRGWFADPFHQVAVIRLRCGSNAAQLDPRSWLALPRRDVIEALSKQFGFDRTNCGFFALASDVYTMGAIPYFELETHTGDAVFKRLAAPPRSISISTIKEVLSGFDLRYTELTHAYDSIIGPAIAAMNDFRQAQRVATTEMTFGPQPAEPRCSIVIPLYGRIDFMEYQLAFFAGTLAADHELIYVLDDPTLQRQAEALAESCLARFARPFRLICLAANVGYAPANNFGLHFARGQHVCFLNSDVFPKTPDWLERMLRTAARPGTGIVGARLLFEDDTVQHDGCAFETLPEFGGWTFCLHPGKGLAPGADDAPIIDVPAVTGACLLISTALARDLGGFDPGYVIGDFEDADLCCKVRDRGLACVVDRTAVLYHLERQSQGTQQADWRLNLTLYNAWRFQRRWGRTIEAAARA